LPTSELWFVIGGDALAEMPRWQRAAEVVRLARMAAVQRPGTTLDLAALNQKLPGLRDRTTLIAGPHLEISSTDLRLRLAEGRPVRYQLPNPVLAYIEERGLYR
jgi:nicotinate-nucleotide adenylyltransferase